jgi:hypothetical protein
VRKRQKKFKSFLTKEITRKTVKKGNADREEMARKRRKVRKLRKCKSVDIFVE